MRSLSKKEKVGLFVVDTVGKTMNWGCTHLRDRNYELVRDDVHNILLLEPWGIGDLVIASYCLPALRKCFNNANITVLCSPVAAELMAGCPYADEVVPYKFQWTNPKNKYSLLRYDWKSLVSFISDMKRMEFDIALTGRPDPRYNLLSWLFGAKSRIGFGSRGGGSFLTSELGTKAEHQHHLGRWEAVLRIADCMEKPFRHGFWLSTAELQEANRVIAGADLSRDNVIVGIHCGASKLQRQWSIDKFAEVARQISRHPDTSVLIFSDPGGANMRFPSKGCSVLPRVNLRVLAALLSRVDVLLCNDSGPMHIAAAVGTPVVGLFGRSIPEEFGPFGSAHTIVEGKVDCRPCYVPCKYDQPKCWPTISVQEVVKALEIQITRLSQKKETKVRL